jgi:PAS fold
MRVEYPAPASIGFNQPFTEQPSAVRRPPPCMRLRAVRSLGLVTDFVWHHANAAAATLFHQSPQALRGQSMGELPEVVRRGQPALIDCYRRIFEQARTQSFDHVHWVEGRQEVVIHRVVCEPNGIAVTLTNLSANRRAQASRLRAEAHDAGRRRNI